MLEDCELIYETEGFRFWSTPDSIYFEAKISGYVTWEDFDEAQEISTLLAASPKGSC